MINLSRVIKSGRFSQPVNFERVTTITNGNGQAEIIDKQSVTMLAIVQPAGEEDLKLLPEGERALPVMAVDTVEELGYGDFMHFNSKRWRVVNVGDWSSYGYYHCLMVRHDGTEASDSTGFGIAKQRGA